MSDAEAGDRFPSERTQNRRQTSGSGDSDGDPGELVGRLTRQERDDKGTRKQEARR